ncbi:MAG: DUF362 domain-containing protein [Candidatus Coatesbacteria bacterium]|nr:DUF362 domain-containing protein [Candidatus Coatesbacteria bacterium]
MTKSKLYFVSARNTKWLYQDSLPGKFERMLAQFRFENYIKKDEWIAVKIHWGSEGAFRPIRATFIRKTVDRIKAAGGDPFITETVRIPGLDYLHVANYNGISQETCGAPLVLADGLFGNDNILVESGPLIGKVAVASVIHDVQAMVVLTHFKGHIQAGIGGALKHLSMGGISARHRSCKGTGRGGMHLMTADRMKWDKKLCTFCMACVEVCPCKAASFEDKKLKVDDKRCWACGRCARVCPNGALFDPIDVSEFQLRLIEGAKAVLSTFQKDKIVYVNCMLDIQPECDCMPGADVAVSQDVGILIGDDPVAIDQASLDMVNAQNPLPNCLASDLGLKPGGRLLSDLHRPDPQIGIDEAVRLGLGRKEYEVENLS